MWGRATKVLGPAARLLRGLAGPPEQRIEAHWNEVTRRRAGFSVQERRIAARWVASPFIQGWISRRISGVAYPKPSQGLRHVLAEGLRGRVLGEAVSIGGGAAAREMELIEEGLVGHFTVYELSAVRIEEGRKAAERRGLADRIAFVHGDGLKAAADRDFDLVHWHAALHHMFDTRGALRWSRAALKPGGVLYVHEYVGPRFLQYTDEMLAWASAIRAMLPADYLTREGFPPVEATVRKRSQKVIMRDPSESVDSENILPGLAESFPEATVWPLGGIGYVIALKDLVGRFNERRPRDREWLHAVMTVDDALSARGLNLRAAALAFV
jgi:SAM-dependent methyltransferase